METIAITPSRSRCPTCICGYDGIDEHEGIPSVKVIQEMTLVSFLELLENLNIAYDTSGTQEIVLSGNLDGICQQKRRIFLNKLEGNRFKINELLLQQASEYGC